jgi:hypothetical protein
MAQFGTLQHPALTRVRNEPDGISDAEQQSLNGTTGSDNVPSDRPSSLQKRKKPRKDAVNRITQPAVKIDNTGEITSLYSTETAKLALKLGVQLRDLRLLDPQVWCCEGFHAGQLPVCNFAFGVPCLQLASVSPPAILDREHAIVVNLGSVKW